MDSNTCRSDNWSIISINEFMKASELRIGNLIEWEDESHGIVRVTAIKSYKESEDIIRFEELSGAGEGGAQLDEFIPVKLTEEWLLKFGFKVSENKLVYDHPTPAIPEDEHKDLGTSYPAFFFNKRLDKWMDCHTRVTIQYVHQLQNLYFALTGEELTIKE